MDMRVKKSNERSPARKHEESVETQSALRNYLPPLNDKTDQELKSEEFNRKQIIDSSRENYHQSYEKAQLHGQFRVYRGNDRREHNSRNAAENTHSFNPINHQPSPDSRKPQPEATPQSSLLDSQASILAERHRNHALRNRSGSNSQSRSKSPSQASNIIRRKYSQMRTLDHQPERDTDYPQASPTRNLTLNDRS